MKGLELAKAYFETYGLPMLENDFADIFEKIAIGLIGPGSECFGFDDQFSLDHDFEPGFCIFLPTEDIISRQEAFQLERAFAKLPKEFMGFKRQKLNPAGGKRHGVFRTNEFFETYVTDFSSQGLIRVPDYILAEACNGQIFIDNYGELTDYRNQILMPHPDVYKKKLAASLMMMDQDGNYNYERCMDHQLPMAAVMCLKDFCSNAIRAIYLLNQKYCPYFKWMFKGAEDFQQYKELKASFEAILLRNEDVKKHIDCIIEVIEQGVSETFNTPKNGSRDLQKIAFVLNDTIENPEIRNFDILFAAY